MEVEREGRVRHVERGRPMDVEKVVVRYRTPGGESSFRALVNPDDGRVLRTWDRAIVDRFEDGGEDRGYDLRHDPDHDLGHDLGHDAAR